MVRGWLTTAIREPRDRHGTVRRRFGTACRWLLTVSLLVLIAFQVDLAELADLLRQIRWEFVVLAFLLGLVDRVLATLRWWLLLLAKGVGITFTPLFLLHLTAGFIGSFLPTSFGVDAVRIAMLVRRAGSGVECTVASIVDRLIMIGGTLLMALVTSLTTAWMLDLSVWIVVMPALCLAGLLLVSSLFHPGVARWLTSRFRFPAGSQARARLTRFSRALQVFHRRRWTLAAAALLTLGILAGRVLVICLLGLSLGLDARLQDYLLVMPSAWVVVMMPISVGGFGLQEGAYVAALTLVGVGVTAVVSLSILDHVVARLVALLGVVVWLVKPDFRLAPAGTGLR